MSEKKGVIALMGSGELTGTMVEVYKELLSGLPLSPQAVFLDTPAGFELNADQISEKAVDYFHKHMNQFMAIASYKGKDRISTYELALTFQKLRSADLVLIGPGSPTYALRQWQQTPIPEILTERAERGGCLVAASAAALTMGRYTLPVYEIYKVGQDLHWVEGMNVLGHFGFNLVVIPHWNNAEGGTHDTRFCYMGEVRLKQLESFLPKDVSLFGLDEHTVCLLDLEKEEAYVKGLGGVTLRRGGIERVFQTGDRFPLEVLQREERDKQKPFKGSGQPAAAPARQQAEETFEDSLHAIEKAFNHGLEKLETKEIISALLELEQKIWETPRDLESHPFIFQARDTFRKLIVSLGIKLESVPRSRTDCLAPLVAELLGLREKFRREQKYEAADAIRQTLEEAEVIVEDTRDGSRWRLKETSIQ
jgi:peptidase E